MPISGLGRFSFFYSTELKLDYVRLLRLEAARTCSVLSTRFAHTRKNSVLLRKGQLAVPRCVCVRVGACMRACLLGSARPGSVRFSSVRSFARSFVRYFVCLCAGAHDSVGVGTRPYLCNQSARSQVLMPCNLRVWSCTTFSVWGVPPEDSFCQCLRGRKKNKFVDTMQGCKMNDASICSPTQRHATPDGSRGVGHKMPQGLLTEVRSPARKALLEGDVLSGAKAAFQMLSVKNWVCESK